MATNNRSNRGFASMDPEERREMARRGGRASHGYGREEDDGRYVDDDYDNNYGVSNRRRGEEEDDDYDGRRRGRYEEDDDYGSRRRNSRYDEDDDYENRRRNSSYDEDDDY